MRTVKYFLMSFVTLSLISGSCLAQELVVYPAQGQSEEQMEKDKFECYGWAKQQSGFDPMLQPTASEPAPQPEAQKGGLVRGGARGALIGVTAGAIAGDAGKGAGIGAATGALGGGMRQRDQQRKQAQSEQQWADKEVTEYTQKRSAYDRANGACLEGKGYSVK